MHHPQQLSVGPLTQSDGHEVLAFLSERPVDNVIMAGFIRDNGIVSPRNRGRFFACRNAGGALEGVALLGRGVAFDTRSDAAVEAFASLARESREPHLLMGEDERVQSFWRHYARPGASPRKLREVTILEQRRPFEGCDEEEDLRPARPDELEAVAALHARMVLEETGEDPLATDAEGFRARCLRRIERQRTWILPNGDHIIYKADVVALTPEVAYLEGVYVNPRDRRKGYGRRCLAQMGRRLLKEAASVCLFVDETNPRARDFYLSLSYLPTSRYHILYF